MADDAFDIVIIGGGPGGYVAAIRAAQLGLSCAVIERELLGGICLNWGCIPTKALLRTAELYHLMGRAGEFGLSADNVGYDIAKIVKRSRDVAGRLNSGVKHLLKKNKVTVIEGNGRIAGAGRVAVETGGETREIGAKNIIIATGARAREIPGMESDGELIWTYRHAMVPDHMPKSLLVVGSGAIGIEFASFYRLLGADVTVVEVLDRILPVEDAEISALAEKAFKKQGMRIHTGATVAALKKGADAVTATIELADNSIETVVAERVIMAVGIAGNVEDVGLEEAGIVIEGGHVLVNEWGETGTPGIYAIGDVAGPPWLAHKASHEGVACVERIAGVADGHGLDKSNIPGCTYSLPQIASVGLTEAAAMELGHEVRIGRFPYLANGKAIAMGETEGLVKTVFDAQTGELLGAHMIGAEVTELIHGYVVARTLETTEAELMATIYPHPTLSEMMHESVLDAFGRVIHF